MCLFLKGEEPILVRMAHLRHQGTEISHVSPVSRFLHLDGILDTGPDRGAKEPVARDSEEIELGPSSPHPRPSPQSKKCSNPNLNSSQDRASYYVCLIKSREYGFCCWFCGFFLCSWLSSRSKGEEPEVGQTHVNAPPHGGSVDCPQDSGGHHKV